jgi:hypothetical protein
VFGKLVRKVGDKCVGRRISWKFLLKLGKEAEICEMLREAYGDRGYVEGICFLVVLSVFPKETWNRREF